MNGWSWLGLFLGLLLLGDALKLRRRVKALPVLRPSTRDAELAAGLTESMVLLLGPGAELDAASRAAAVGFAREHGLSVLDLLPARWPALRAVAFAQLVDPATFPTALLAPGTSAGQALLVAPELLARAGAAGVAPTNALEFLQLARKLKRYAPRGFGFAVAPGLMGVVPSASDRFDVQRALFLDLTPSVLAGQLALFALLAAAAWAGGVAGAAGLIAFQLQPAIALAGSPLRSRGLLSAALFGLPWQLWEWLAAIAAAKPDAARLAMSEERRPLYADAVVGGLERFFEPRREDCYVCGGKRLAVARRHRDLLQHKPGYFTLERCRDCGHLFQNPRLSLAGLDYYYRDFYDGLGEGWLETIFALAADSYVERAHEISGAAPRRWLDVGGGYGHFCLVAREVWPQTEFDCLDMGESVEEGVRRGWVHRGHRGLFPQLADSLAGQYDAVSLSHCLEHTRDPRAEIAAAHRVLAPGGALLIEVPDPECGLRHLFRSRWLPYFQPQHQHLLSVHNLRRLLEEAGFEVASVERRGHTGFDAFFAVFLSLDRWAPPVGLPWRRPPRAWERWRRGLVWGLGAPALLGAVLFDSGVKALLGVPGFSNAYRVVARLPKGA